MMHTEKTLESEMLNLFARLNEAEKKSVIRMLRVFLKSRKAASKNIKIEQYNRELQEAEAEYQNGEYIVHKEFVKQIKTW